jgi:hypothetical protein
MKKRVNINHFLLRLLAILVYQDNITQWKNKKPVCFVMLVDLAIIELVLIKTIIKVFLLAIYVIKESLQRPLDMKNAISVLLGGLCFILYYITLYKYFSV